MNLIKTIALLGAIVLAPSALAQMTAPGGEDQVDQLAEAIGLTDSQQAEVRAVIDDLGPQIEALQEQAEGVQVELRSHVGHDYDESAIRAGAARLGELTGEVTALSLLLQSKVQAVFTAEQRQELEVQAQRQREMQEQMMRQQFQQQQQQGQPQQPDW